MENFCFDMIVLLLSTLEGYARTDSPKIGAIFKFFTTVATYIVKRKIDRYIQGKDREKDEIIEEQEVIIGKQQ